jgi:hypothetical protein
MWWSRESRERRKEALAQRPHIEEALAEAAPTSQEIDDLLRSKGISVWTAIVALAARTFGRWDCINTRQREG